MLIKSAVTSDAIIFPRFVFEGRDGRLGPSFEAPGLFGQRRDSIRNVHVTASGAEYGVQVGLGIAVEHPFVQDDLSERTCGGDCKREEKAVSQSPCLGLSRVSRSTHKMGRFDRKGSLECGVGPKNVITQFRYILRNDEI